MSKNTNCLEGLACPKCGQDDKLLITGVSVFEVIDDGTKDHGEVEYDMNSPAACPVWDCGFAGDLGDFRIREAS